MGASVLLEQQGVLLRQLGLPFQQRLHLRAEEGRVLVGGLRRRPSPGRFLGQFLLHPGVGAGHGTALRPAVPPPGAARPCCCPGCLDPLPGPSLLPRGRGLGACGARHQEKYWRPSKVPWYTLAGARSRASPGSSLSIVKVPTMRDSCSSASRRCRTVRTPGSLDTRRPAGVENAPMVKYTFPPGSSRSPLRKPDVWSQNLSVPLRPSGPSTAHLPPCTSMERKAPRPRGAAGP
mmetsp:Transcript_9918/g.27862  ORF Transcript_9918/g.27862 Transcript_9918/m.27862 type:complete len:234 (+) Transcript_9918:863-1564(+)